jgi:hypothetical protein
MPFGLAADQTVSLGWRPFQNSERRATVMMSGQGELAECLCAVAAEAHGVGAGRQVEDLLGGGDEPVAVMRRFA